MKYELKDCRTGGAGMRPTTVTLEEREGELRFTFTAEETEYYCPYEGYNRLHSQGDACELLIGSDSLRKRYYEIELSANGDLMVAKMTYRGVDERAGYEPILDLAFVEEKDCFVQGKVERTKKGYVATLRFKKEAIRTGDGEIFFNAYRLETDGGETDKHLLALNPTLRPKFHVPERFVLLKDYL